MIHCPHCNSLIRYITDAQHIFIVDVQEKTLITDRGRMVKGYPLHVCPAQKQRVERAGSDIAADGKNTGNACAGASALNVQEALQ